MATPAICGNKPAQPRRRASGETRNETCISAQHHAVAEAAICPFRQARAECAAAGPEEMVAEPVRASSWVPRLFPDIPHHMILFGPRYRGLRDDIYTTGVLAEDFALYLHHPSASDASLAPPGHSSFYALAPVQHLGDAPLDWAVEGTRAWLPAPRSLPR